MMKREPDSLPNYYDDVAAGNLVTVTQKQG